MERAMSTYYTPEASEFCLGFAFEAKKNSGLVPEGIYEEGQEWKQTEWRYFDFMTPRYNFEYFRVKHLDREDIEGEGFKATTGFYEEGEIATGFYEESEIAIGFWNDEIEASLTMYHNGCIRISGGSNKPWFLFFHGRILNLTEFRKLMKQLNIKKP